MWELTLSWDGALVATPAGSTGHSKSYFWPVIPHASSSLIITPKGNSSPEAPKIITDTSTINISNSGRKFPLAVNIDGVQRFVSQYDEKVDLEITKLSDTVTLLIESNHTSDWDAKVMQQQWFKL